MISNKIKERRILSILEKMNQIYEELTVKSFNSLSSIKKEFGGNYLLYSFLKNKKVLLLKDEKFIWNNKVKPDKKLAAEYFEYQYMKYKLSPSRIMRDTKYLQKDKKPEVIEISIPEKKKHEFSILWGLLKFKF